MKIRDLLRWCLQKDPRRRLRDIGDARIEIDEPSESPVTVPRHRYVPWAMAALLFGVAVWSFLRPVEQPERAVSRFTVNLPPEQRLTNVNDPAVALSPDGRRLVYVGGIGSERRLYVRSLDKLEARPIPATEGADSAFFSPDGEWVGFYGAGKLKKVRLDGGLPITLCDVPDGWGASWGPGEIILFAPTASGLSRISASGSSASVVTTPDASQGETSHRWPEILPGGKSALFTILTATGTPRIGLLSLETGEYRVLLEGGSFARYVPTGHLVYVRDGALVAAPFDLEGLELTGQPVSILEEVWTPPANGTAHLTFSRDGTFVYVPRFGEESTLVWVDRRGAVRPITDTRRGFEDPRLSPDGQRLSVSIKEQGKLHIWIYEMARASFVKLSFGPDEDQAAIWTPDGKRLTFRRGLESNSNLFWQPADGSGPEERLTTSPFSQRASSWSPDGKMLVYRERRDLWLLDLVGEPKQRPFLETPFGEPFGVVSPDGRFLAYISNESGTWEIYVRPFPGPGGGKWKISNEGGIQPVWARSGREIFYRNGDKMMAIATETEPAFRAGTPVVLFEGKFHRPDVAFAQYDVAADGKHFVMIQDVESGPTQIHVVLNWFEELKQRVPSPKR